MTQDVYNPWRESLENCIEGCNYLRASEYRELIGELDLLYAMREVGRYRVSGGRIVEWEFLNAADERPDGTYTLHSPPAASGNTANARSDKQ